MRSRFNFLKKWARSSAKKSGIPARHDFSGLPVSYLLLIGGIGLLLVAGIAVRAALAHTGASPASPPSTLHPTFALLDAGGENVLESGGPISTMNTCGQCHDTAFIASHSIHADLGADVTPLPGPWNPLTYRTLLPDGNTSTWIKENASRLVGGGLAEAQGMEMNCFLCHTAHPNNNARIAALQAGQFEWAASATLLGSGLVEHSGETFTWNASAFDATGNLLAPFVQDPTNQNCAQCHGIAHEGQDPLTLTAADLDPQGGNWQTLSTGQVIAAEKISQSGVNLASKDDLSRSWDIHAERGLQCTDCHYALNNPAYYQSENSPEHLEFDPRRLEIGEYLQRPDHNFARGQSAQVNIAPELKGTMRRCESCHDASQTHDWLPYASRHLEELACESCHIPNIYAPAVQAVDWTVLQADQSPRITYRGVEGDSQTVNDLITGYQPVLLPRQNVDGGVQLAPYNLITTWFWAYGAGNQPVALADLQAAYFEEGGYAPAILAALDGDQNGELSQSELAFDTPDKVDVVRERLKALGLHNPHITGEIRPYSINHNVTNGEWLSQDCASCHSDSSRLSGPILLSTYTPGGAQPQFAADTNTMDEGTHYTDESGALYYKPVPHAANLYIFGHNRVAWVDILGALMFVGVLGAISVHGGLRFFAALRNPSGKGQNQKVYIYSVYERFWHWLQTFAIVLLLLTGLVIHRPDIFGLFSFRGVVVVHNTLAVLLVLNAALSLFYHLVSGEIKQYIPRPYGFFDEAIVQARYYIEGIFRHDPHPFEKTPEKKLNPLQSITYFGILNVLLPLQIISGALMWGVQHWPTAANLLGGLPFLAPFHSLVAWAFAAFIVAHVYLTTTGAEPLTAIQAMMTGWEEIESGAAGQRQAEMPETQLKPASPEAEASIG